MRIYRVKLSRIDDCDEGMIKEDFVIATENADSAIDIALTMTNNFCKYEPFTDIETTELTQTDNGIEIAIK